MFWHSALLYFFFRLCVCAGAVVFKLPYLLACLRVGVLFFFYPVPKGFSFVLWFNPTAAMTISDWNSVCDRCCCLTEISSSLLVKVIPGGFFEGGRRAERQQTVTQAKQHGRVPRTHHKGLLDVFLPSCRVYSRFCGLCTLTAQIQTFTLIYLLNQWFLIYNPYFRCRWAADSQCGFPISIHSIHREIAEMREWGNIRTINSDVARNTNSVRGPPSGCRND